MTLKVTDNQYGLLS